METNSVKKINKSRMEGLGPVDRAEAFCHGWLGAHCDGALKSGDALHSGLGIAGGITDTALKTIRGSRSVAASENMFSVSQVIDAETRDTLLQQTDSTTIAFSLSGARVWMQPVNSRKLALQWLVPANVRRNCRDLIEHDNPEFVLRLYRHNDQALKWKASHRTLEFPVDISRKKCYIKLEQAGGRFNAELGVKLGDGRYVFLARSTECSAARVMPDVDSIVNFVEHVIPQSKVAAVPSVFLTDVCAVAGVVPECDYPWLDLQAEAQVRAVYADFLIEGSRVFRNRQTIEIKPLAERRAKHAQRALTRSKATTEKAKESSATVKRASLVMQRVDAFEAAPVRNNDAKITNYPVLSGYSVERLTRQQALAFAVIPHLCQMENLISVEHFNRHELATKTSASRRRTVHVKSSKELTEAIRDGRIGEQAEIVLRGKVKPGRRVRVGGLLIDTQSDGSFCVACVIRNGRLHVPVEEVAAVCVE